MPSNANGLTRVAVLGSTGSIGTSTLDVIAGCPEHLVLAGVAAHSRMDALAEQIARHRPPIAVLIDEAKAAELAARVNGTTRVLAGVEGLIELATHPDVDVVVVGTAGREALVPVLRAIEAGKRIALASKELLVMAGALIMRLAREHGAVLLPVDSEHAALAQALAGVRREALERVIITGTGGPLWTMDREAMARVTREEVLRHPKWSMGPKITVDSATLMNKGLEVIEAHWLFDLPLEQISVLIHPQALVHAIVELSDGSCLAQMSICDMRLPIQSALSFPERWPSRLPRLDWTRLPLGEFFTPDLERFPCLRLALEAARAGGSAPVVLSAVNELAVKAFLDGRLPFAEIPSIIERSLARHTFQQDLSLDGILEVDAWARETARLFIGTRTQAMV